MIDRADPLPVTKQAKLLGVSRSGVYYLPAPISAIDQQIMVRIDRLHLEFPFAGARMLRGLLRQEGFSIGRLHNHATHLLGLIMKATLDRYRWSKYLPKTARRSSRNPFRRADQLV